MKNIAIFLLIVLSASSFSCDFLEEEPKGLISDTYAKTEEGVESLILSIYQRNRYLTERLYKFADCGTDLTTYATNGVGWPYEEAMIYNDPLMISNRWNSQYWKYLYKGLNVANLGVQYIQETPIAHEEKKNQLISEVHALRAFYLFMIVETYGPASHYADTPSQSVITEGYQPGIAVFYKKNNISCYYLTDTDYPVRLRECPDAPILFYFKGNTNLDATRIISIVGTRNATEYGRELTESLIKDLAKVIPDLLVVSGLAYGIDICAHRNALYNRLPTVAVLAHGLDRIYPSCHRNTAVEMLESGGLLTDFPSGTEPDRPNFLRRNRIVAGISDCTIVVESAEKGGSLVTADIAFSYGRDVYSFPGRIGDSHSKGCNNLIRQNKAGLITSADDLLSALCWDIQAGATSVQTELFFAEAETFTSEQNPVLAIMRTRNEIHINELASVLEIPVHQLSMLLFELEINGKVKALPGNLYKLS